jgi:hypothetical protein
MTKITVLRVKVRIWICILAALTLGLTLSTGRAAAEAPTGPQSGATPSDEPNSSPAPRAVAQIGGHPSLGGSRTLNKDRSDDPREKLYLTTKIDNPRFQQPVTFRFIYDTANAKGGGSK